jgi:hypothetical protein
MADAEDLKSSGDFSSCGFDSHPGHHSLTVQCKGLSSRAASTCQLRASFRSRTSILQKRSDVNTLSYSMLVIDREGTLL